MNVDVYSNILDYISINAPKKKNLNPNVEFVSKSFFTEFDRLDKMKNEGNWAIRSRKVRERQKGIYNINPELRLSEFESKVKKIQENSFDIPSTSNNRLVRHAPSGSFFPKCQIVQEEVDHYHIPDLKLTMNRRLSKWKMASESPSFLIKSDHSSKSDIERQQPVKEFGTNFEIEKCINMNKIVHEEMPVDLDANLEYDSSFDSPPDASCLWVDSTTAKSSQLSNVRSQQVKITNELDKEQKFHVNLNTSSQITFMPPSELWHLLSSAPVPSRISIRFKSSQIPAIEFAPFKTLNPISNSQFSILNFDHPLDTTNNASSPVPVMSHLVSVAGIAHSTRISASLDSQRILKINDNKNNKIRETNHKPILLFDFGVCPFPPILDLKTPPSPVTCCNHRELPPANNVISRITMQTQTPLEGIIAPLFPSPSPVSVLITENCPVLVLVDQNRELDNYPLNEFSFYVKLNQSDETHDISDWIKNDFIPSRIKILSLNLTEHAAHLFNHYGVACFSLLLNDLPFNSSSPSDNAIITASSPNNPHLHIPLQGSRSAISILLVASPPSRHIFCRSSSPLPLHESSHSLSSSSVFRTSKAVLSSAYPSDPPPSLVRSDQAALSITPLCSSFSSPTSSNSSPPPSPPPSWPEQRNIHSRSFACQATPRIHMKLNPDSVLLTSPSRPITLQPYPFYKNVQSAPSPSVQPTSTTLKNRSQRLLRTETTMCIATKNSQLNSQLNSYLPRHIKENKLMSRNEPVYPTSVRKILKQRMDPLKMKSLTDIELRTVAFYSNEAANDLEALRIATNPLKRLARILSGQSIVDKISSIKDRSKIRKASPLNIKLRTKETSFEKDIFNKKIRQSNK